jgi:hypothetical protein
MKAVSSQRGASLIGGLILLAAIGLLGIAGMRMVPHYMDFWAVKKAMDKASSQPSTKVEGGEEYFDYVNRSLQVNNIRDLDLKNALKITEQPHALIAHLAYEKREHFVGNLDLVVRFDHQSSVRLP